MFGQQLECGHAAIGSGAQRVAVDGHGVGAAPLDGVTQVVDELRVPAEDVGSVEDDTDRWPNLLQLWAVSGRNCNKFGKR